MICEICGKKQDWNICDNCAGFNSTSSGENVDYDQLMLDQGVIPSDMF